MCTCFNETQGLRPAAASRRCCCPCYCCGADPSSQTHQSHLGCVRAPHPLGAPFSTSLSTRPPHLTPKSTVRAIPGNQLAVGIACVVTNANLLLFLRRIRCSHEVAVPQNRRVALSARFGRLLSVSFVAVAVHVHLPHTSRSAAASLVSLCVGTPVDFIERSKDRFCADHAAISGLQTQAGNLSGIHHL